MSTSQHLKFTPPSGKLFLCWLAIYGTQPSQWRMEKVLATKESASSFELKSGRPEFLKTLAVRFFQYSPENIILNSFKESKTALLHKKSDEEDKKNYCQICLLHYKLSMTIITNCLPMLPDELEPREQAGFQRIYSTIDSASHSEPDDGTCKGV